MSEKITQSFNRFMNDESGQGITEYGAILAFVAILVGIAFGFQAPLKTAISAAFQAVVTQLNTLTAAS